MRRRRGIRRNDVSIWRQPNRLILVRQQIFWRLSHWTFHSKEATFSWWLLNRSLSFSFPRSRQQHINNLMAHDEQKPIRRENDMRKFYLSSLGCNKIYEENIYCFVFPPSTWFFTVAGSICKRAASDIISAVSSLSVNLHSWYKMLIENETMHYRRPLKSDLSR